MVIRDRLWFRCVLAFIATSTFIALSYNYFRPGELTISGLPTTYIVILSIAISLPLGTLLSIIWDIRKIDKVLGFYEKGFSWLLGASLILVLIIVSFGISIDTVYILGFMLAYEGLVFLGLELGMRDKHDGEKDSSKLSKTQN